MLAGRTSFTGADCVRFQFKDSLRLEGWQSMLDPPAATSMRHEPRLFDLGPPLHLEIGLHPLQLRQQHVPVRDRSSRFYVGVPILGEKWAISNFLTKAQRSDRSHHYDY